LDFLLLSCSSSDSSGSGHVPWTFLSALEGLPPVRVDAETWGKFNPSLTGV